MKLIKNISKKDFARNTIITFLLMTVATIISFVLFYTPNFSPAVFAPIYILVIYVLIIREIDNITIKVRG